METLQLAWVICKIGVCTLFRRVFCIRPAAPRPEFSPVCIGLTGSGKTTILTLLSGQSIAGIKPTTGFEIKAAQFKDFILNVKEIGGGEKIRPYWKQYYAGACGIVFVVDSASDEESLDIAAQELLLALSNPMLHGEPCLILCNCQDKPGAKNIEELTRLLDTEIACNGRKWLIEPCTMNDVASIREPFEKFGQFLLPEEVTDVADTPEHAVGNKI